LTRSAMFELDKNLQFFFGTNMALRVKTETDG
jgi:hypothetical protein